VHFFNAYQKNTDEGQMQMQMQSVGLRLEFSVV
jgi:hypothetical protein